MACPTLRAAPGCLVNADGDGTRVRVQVQVLTNVGALALSTEAPDGGWGLAGHATTNAELAQGRRRDSGPPGPRTGN
jgi:hypothetical protein